MAFIITIKNEGQINILNLKLMFRSAYIPFCSTAFSKWLSFFSSLLGRLMGGGQGEVVMLLCATFHFITLCLISPALLLSTFSISTESDRRNFTRVIVLICMETSVLAASSYAIKRLSR